MEMRACLIINTVHKVLLFNILYFNKKMERRARRVSEAQWGILMQFLESNPNLARTRNYNNTTQGRAESLRLWKEVANLLNAEGSGTTKSPQDWSTYVSNYKSKLKKVVADINADASATGEGPPQASTLSEWNQRFLALMGPGFGQTAPRVMVQPFPDEPSTSESTAESQSLLLDARINSPEIIIDTLEEPVQHSEEDAPVAMQPPSPRPEPLLPRRTRRTRQRTRPLAPLDEARRILSEVEMQRAAADAANARAHELMADNLLPLADIAQNLGRLATVAERYVEYLITRLDG